MVDAKVLQVDADWSVLEMHSLSGLAAFGKFSFTFMALNLY